MAQQPARPSFNLNLGALTTADKLILGGAGLFFIWSFFSVWYKVSAGAGCTGVCSVSFNGWHGVTTFAVILALVALVWTGARLAGVTKNVQVNFPLAYIDLGLAGLALFFTLLGLVVHPSFFVVKAGLQWGIFIALILALVWAYGAWMKYQEPAAAPPAAGPPAGGFSA